jgi:hypothetical protein
MIPSLSWAHNACRHEYVFRVTKSSRMVKRSLHALTALLFVLGLFGVATMPARNDGALDAA